MPSQDTSSLKQRFRILRSVWLWTKRYLLSVVAALTVFALLWDHPFLDDMGVGIRIALCVCIVSPVIVTLAFDLLRRWRNHRLAEWSKRGNPAVTDRYFRLTPYDNSANDRARFHRADGLQDKVFEWIDRSQLPLLFLSGVSGSGKTSLLNASVIPRLNEDPAPGSDRISRFRRSNHLTQRQIARTWNCLAAPPCARRN